jgi:predicted nucleotidyltransferase component of viral defense system
MLSKYECRAADDYIHALREILQEIALLGLWRGKFFEKAAFYGGTALRVLYGLNRFSEDMDFSLLDTQKDFDISAYSGFVEEELQAFGFNAAMERKQKSTESNVESAFLKANTKEHLLIVQTNEAIANAIPPNQTLRIKIEVDTDPPPLFSTETKFLLNPIPFSVRAFGLPSLFAGKVHAVLCRRWKNRVKGRDWYDLTWYVSRKIKLDIGHLEARMRQSGHYEDAEPLTPPKLLRLLSDRIASLDVEAASRDVRRFLGNPSDTDVWSGEFFEAVVQRIEFENS